MNAPDKIYLIDFPTLGISDHWYEKQRLLENFLIEGKNVEYIRKDLLLEWAKDMKKGAEYKFDDESGDMYWGYETALDELIDKLNSL